MEFRIEYGYENKGLPDAGGQTVMREVLVYTAFLVNDQGVSIPVFQTVSMNRDEFYERIKKIARHFENDPTVGVADLVVGEPGRNGKHKAGGKLVIATKQKEEHGD